jgi:ComF family protein
LCAGCRASPLTIDSIRSLTLFDGRIRHAVHAFKYRRVAALAEPLGDALARFWMQTPTPARAIVPVPLHPLRRRERGYNQAELLARRVGRAARLPVYPDALRRVRATAVQMTLDAAQRRANVAEAFECIAPELRGAAVLLIDDVCTTGATLDACAVALKAAGAEAVHGLTLARTP